MPRRTEYDIVPDTALMEDIGATSFTVAEAIVELVANSVDARLDGLKMDIQVDVTPDEIRVIDNGKGMTEDILAEAVRLGVKMDKITQGDGSRKGMFGLGMKTAAASLGRHWSVTTRPRGTNHEYYVEFDLSRWTGNSGKRGDQWKVSIEERAPDAKGVLGNREHGTAISVRNLRERQPLPGPVLERLGDAYRPHIENGDIIRVGTDEAKPRVYDLLPGSKVPVDVSCGKHRITGWVGLDKKTHNDDFFGLNLYRKGQLLVPWDKSWFRVHLMTSRIVGEVNLDFVPPNFHKKGFEKQSVEWKMAETAMREALKPVVRASETASKGRKDQMRFTRAVQGLRRAMGVAPEVPGENSQAEPQGQDDTATSTGQGGDSSEEDAVRGPGDIGIEAKALNFSDGRVWLTFQLEELLDDQVPWDYLYDEEARELQAVVNTASALFAKSKDEAFLGTLALADCVAEFLIKERRLDPALARSIRNKWLYVSVKAS